MAIFNFDDSQAIGTVFSVDTATVIIKVQELEKLRKLHVNQLVAIRSAKAGQHLIGQGLPSFCQAAVLKSHL